MPTYHAVGVKVNLVVANLRDSTSHGNLDLRNGSEATREVKRCEDILKEGRILKETMAPEKGKDGWFNYLGDKGDMPFMMVEAGHELFERTPEPTTRPTRRRVASGGSDARSTKARTKTPLGPSKPKDSQTIGRAGGLVGMPPVQLTPHALGITLSLSERSFIRYLKPHRPGLDIKIDIYFNGEFAESTFSPFRITKSGDERDKRTLVFSGRRVHRFFERPWVIVPPGQDPSGSLRPKKRGKAGNTVDERWSAIARQLAKESNELGLNQYGEKTPVGEYLACLAKMEMPDAVRSMQKPGAHTPGIIDVVLTVGKGVKDSPKTQYIGEPTRLRDEKYKKIWEGMEPQADSTTQAPIVFAGPSEAGQSAAPVAHMLEQPVDHDTIDGVHSGSITASRKTSRLGPNTEVGSLTAQVPSSLGAAALSTVDTDDASQVTGFRGLSGITEYASAAISVDSDEPASDFAQPTSRREALIMSGKKPRTKIIARDGFETEESESDEETTAQMSEEEAFAHAEKPPRRRFIHSDQAADEYAADCSPQLPIATKQAQPYWQTQGHALGGRPDASPSGTKPPPAAADAFVLPTNSRSPWPQAQDGASNLNQTTSDEHGRKARAYSVETLTNSPLSSAPSTTSTRSFSPFTTPLVKPQSSRRKAASPTLSGDISTKRVKRDSAAGVGFADELNENQQQAAIMATADKASHEPSSVRGSAANTPIPQAFRNPFTAPTRPTRRPTSRAFSDDDDSLTQADDAELLAVPSTTRSARDATGLEDIDQSSTPLSRQEASRSQVMVQRRSRTGRFASGSEVPKTPKAPKPPVAPKGVKPPKESRRFREPRPPREPRLPKRSNSSKESKPPNAEKPPKTPQSAARNSKRRKEPGVPSDSLAKGIFLQQTENLTTSELSQDCVITYAKPLVDGYDEDGVLDQRTGIKRQVKAARAGVFEEHSILVGMRFLIGEM